MVSVPFMKIDWKYVNENDGSIRYTNIIPGDDDNGGYIEFAKVDDSVFNRYFKLLTTGISVIGCSLSCG